ncbi:MAG: hypothetical protein HY908_18725 [Myxococcales bacterium]|nr:hypothetical protein [Myxococcales bacterium]
MRPFALVVALAVLGLARATRAEVEVDAGTHPCVGRWLGIGNNGNSDWTIDMVVAAPGGARCGTIEYPSLRCGGYLETCEASGPDTLRLVELYTHNPGTCAPAGRLEVSCTGDEMKWRWIGIEVVTTTLRRAPGSVPPPPAPPGRDAGPGDARLGDAGTGDAHHPDDRAPPPPVATAARPEREARGCSCRVASGTVRGALPPPVTLVALAAAWALWRTRGRSARAAPVDR